MAAIVTEMGVPGEAWRVAPGVIRVLAPNAGPLTGPGTNTYIVGDGPAVIIDPGPDDPAHIAAVIEAVGALAEPTIDSVLVTHHHGDHWPAARALADHYDCNVVSHGPHGALRPDQRMPAGGLKVVKGARLRAIHTPGHASDHLCFLLEESDILFTGDFILSGTTTVVAPPDGDMADYMRSLFLVRGLGVKHIMPGHGCAIVDAPATIDYYIEHRTQRESAIRRAVESGESKIEAIVTTIYTDVPDFMHPVARYSVLAHLVKLIDEGSVRVLEDDLALPPARIDDAGGDDDATSDFPIVAPPMMAATFVPPSAI